MAETREAPSHSGSAACACFLQLQLSMVAVASLYALNMLLLLHAGQSQQSLLA
jgi:hypothetical protein